MDDLLREFLTETNESLDVVDVELVRFEQDPNNAKILDNIFRLVHTIKGTCGFLGLPRLEALAHAAETLMGKFRDGMPVTGEAVTLILSTIDRIKSILDELEQHEQEPSGADRDLIDELERMVVSTPINAPPGCQEGARRRPPRRAARSPIRCWNASCVRARCRSTSSSAPSARRPGRTPVAPLPVAKAPAKAERQARAPSPTRRRPNKVANQSIRVNVETLEHLMTMVSELVLTRNQLLEIVRRHEDSRVQGAAAAPVQRHRRAAGRRHEDAHAADRQRLAEAAAHRARSRRPSSASRSSSRCTAPTPSSTARCST